MVRDAKSARRNRENGAKGGNPSLRKGDGNGGSDNPPAQPPGQPSTEPGLEGGLRQIREEGEERREDYSVPDGTGAEAPSKPDDLTDLKALEPKAGAWRLALKVLMDRGGFPQSRARPMVGKWAKDATPAELWQAAESAWRTGTLDPVSYITAALERLREDAAGDPLLRPTETRQRFWMQDFATSPRDWLEHERGPKPGKPGCRVTPEIQREFGLEPAKPQPVGRVA
jgi:hypothetical protein